MSEEKEAIEYIKAFQKDLYGYNEKNLMAIYIDRVWNYIDKLQKENKESKELYNKLLIGYNKLVQECLKLEKVIDLMVEDIYDNDNFWKIKCRVERIEKGKEKDYIKEQFFKKVEEEND